MAHRSRLFTGSLIVLTLTGAALIVSGCATVAGDAPAGSVSGAGLGRHSRTVTTASPEAQKWFDDGLRWMFAFNHDEAVRSFKRAT
ncbi:MAG TPA: hypothetical protein VEB22_14005, partial [Phycisphaerales bacterium]|nr:hypothetical protein [Phycisphaerales bacterium]